MGDADFSDKVKYEARRLAIFKCCLCRELGDHVHHIVPQEDGGSSDLDNAMLLCVRCHDSWGHRPDKRAQLRQAREIWHAYVGDKYSTSDIDALETNVATKSDIEELFNRLNVLIVSSLQSGKMSPELGLAVASTTVSSLVAHGQLTVSPGLPAHLASSSGLFEPPLPMRVIIGKAEPKEST